MQIPFLTKIRNAERILVAGCGGGYDFASGIPLATWLRSIGKHVVHANISFAQLDVLCTERIGPAGWIVDPSCGMADYFPERHFVDWLGKRGLDPLLIGFELTGAVPLRESYEAVVARYGIDAIVLVDGGVDSIAKGDESLLASIDEDAVSVVAVDMLRGVDKYLSCVGFGIDQYHGLCHHSSLENMAELAGSGGFLGAVSIQKGTPEGDAFLDFVDHVNRAQPGHKGVVCNAVAGAMRGEFGDVHATERTLGNRMFVNPLMSLVWTYDLRSVAAMMGFREDVSRTKDMWEVAGAIRLHHASRKHRDWVSIPL